MIPELRPGLKKGERFTDGGRIFLITDVLPNGQYVSQMEGTKEPEEKKPEEEKKISEPKEIDNEKELDKADFLKLSKAELLQLAKKFKPDISEKTKKDELIAFLEEATK